MGCYSGLCQSCEGDTALTKLVHPRFPSDQAAPRLLQKSRASKLTSSAAGASKARALPPAQPGHCRDDSNGSSPVPAQRGRACSLLLRVPARFPGLPRPNASASPGRREPFFRLIRQISGTSPADYTSSNVLQQRAREKTSEQVFLPGENSPACCKLPSPACAARCSRAGDTARRWQMPQSARGQRVWAVRIQRPCAQPCLQPAPGALLIPPESRPQASRHARATPSAPGAPHPVPRCRTDSAKASVKATLRRKAKNQPKTDFSKSYNIWKTRRGGTAGAFKPSARVTAHAKTCFSCFKLG